MAPAKGDDKQQLLAGNNGKAQFGVPLAYVPNYQGVVEERKFHDIFFAVFFLLFFAFCVAIGIWAHAKHERITIVSSVAKSFWREQVDYMEQDVGAIVGLCAMALALALGWLMAIRKWPKFMIYLSIIVCAVLLIASGAFQCYWGFRLAGGAVLGIWGVLIILMGFLLLFIAYRRGASIEFTAVVLAEAGNGLAQNSSLMFIISPITSLMFMAFYFCAVAAIYFLFLVPGVIEYPNANCSAYVTSWGCNSIDGCWYDWDFGSSSSDSADGTCRYTTKASSSIYLIFVIIFGLYWCGNVKIMFNDCVTAGAIAKWYFTRHAPSYSSNVLGAVKNSFWAFGSLSFGALLIAIVQFCRMLLNAAAGKRSGLGVVLFCCLRFLCCLLEGILRYINRYATIYIAMNGTKFWDSCKSVFNLLGRQSGWQAVMNDCILGYINVVGALLCLGVPVTLSVFIIGKDSEHIMSWIVIGIASCLIFVIIARCLRTAVDTVFVCFIEDMERNANGMTFLTSPEFMGSMCRHTKRPATATQYVNWVPATGSPQGVVVVTGQPIQQQPQYPQQQPQYGQPQYQQPGYPQPQPYAQPQYQQGGYPPQQGYPQKGGYQNQQYV